MLEDASLEMYYEYLRNHKAYLPNSYVFLLYKR